MKKLLNLVKKLLPKFLIGLYVLLGIVVSYHVVYAKRIIPGVYIGSLNLGGKTYQEAKSSLEKYIVDSSRDLELSGPSNFRYTLPLSSIKLTYDVDATLDKVFDIGRSGRLLTDNKDKFKGLFSKLNVPAVYDYDDGILSNIYSTLKGEVNIEAANASVYLKDGLVEIQEAQEGKKVVEDGLYNIFVGSFDHLDFSRKEIPLKTIKPSVFASDVRTLLPEINKILSRNVTIKYGNKSWILNREQLITFMDFEKNQNKLDLRISSPRFQAFSDSLSNEVNELPRGQVTSLNGNDVVDFIITKEGKELNSKEFFNRFKIAYFGENTSLELPMSVVSGPNSKEKYGIYALLGEGTSKFEHSIPGRVHNVALAGSRANGVLVPPGGVFSLNNAIGEISGVTGYDVAYIIKGGRTVLGEGGGVCQVSTTVFRAALNSGLPIVMRYPHAYRVSYYEQDSAVGFDASIYQPSLDFQFRNDTPNYVLVQTNVDKQNYAMSVHIFGTPDGRIVEVSQPVVTNQTPPPPPLYQDDETLAKGIVRQVDFPAWGATVKFTRVVKKGDTVLYNDTFTSNYQPWQAIFLVGKKS